MRKVDPVKHEEKRREILEAAGRCFARDGFQGASTSAICAEAGISSGHLYHYFDSKEAIIAAMAQANLDRATAHFNQLVETTDAVGSLVLELAKLDAMIKRPGQPLALDMFAEARRNLALADILQEHSRGMRGLLADLLRKGQARGEVDPDLDPESAATILISLTDGTKTLGIRNPKLDVKKTSKMFTTLVSRFLAPPAKR
jgi:AcrR family transcriptional regulator